jgi:PAS domain S-box-containing protein
MSFGIIDESSITTEISLALLQFGTISTLLISPPTLNWFVQDYRANKIDTDQKFAAIDKSSLVAYFHPNGTIKHMNANLTKFLGWQANELNGQSHKVICPRHVYRSDEYQTCWKHLAQGKPAKGTFLRITKHGDYKYLYCSYNPILDVSGRVVEIMKIANDVTDEMAARQDLQNKNTYLEHAAKILRHDMHSGINTYIPRGISALKRRISDAKKKELRIEAPFRLLEEGLEHTQKVYRGVKEFTNLVRKDVKLEKQEYDLREILVDYLSSTAYKDQVAIDRLPIVEVNEPLFCTAIDNLIRNGLKYNDSEFKMVAITMLDEQTLGVIDNGRGMTQEDFEQYSKPYLRKKNQTESGTGLGLNISIAILKEHGFTITSFHDPTKDEGTILRIKIK